MSTRFIQPTDQRHRREIVNGIEHIIIPAPRHWLTIPFVLVWLTIWTSAGFGAISQFAENFEPFLLVWLAFWAAGWVFAASTLLMQMFGSETLWVNGGNLEIRCGFGPVVRSWHYRGHDIRNLTSNTPSLPRNGIGRGAEWPFFMRPKTGAVRFDHGAATVYMAAGLDEPEGRVIAAWLAQRLPHTASERH
ncbi:hypothetical protein [Sphingomonas sp.]|uniref:hypothetical protein n=1 Tax=Sphingomonas sp. TaxID=28214 RepID=UPI0035AEFB72